MSASRFLTDEQVRYVQQTFGTPVFVYDQRTLEAQARAALAFPKAYGLTVRYAMKALPNRAVIRLFDGLGLHIDASSGFEARRAMLAGVAPEKIQITAQELPRDLDKLLRLGVRFNACSLHQLRTYGALRPGTEVSIRVNSGLGSGHSNRTNVGGPSASFGIWHEHLDEVFAIRREFGLRIARMHTHIGSGCDPEMWNRCARMSLDIVAKLPEVETLNLGGGFKVARMDYETSADLQVIGQRIVENFQEFRATYGRALKLEIEPGTFLVANAGALVCTVIDVVNTGQNGYSFLKIDSGMTELVRPSMYGAQHPIEIVRCAACGARRVEGDSAGVREYLVVGHCCESGDNLTPEPGNPEGLQTRTLPETDIGDALVVGGAGAYAAAMSSKNYNSFPEAPEAMLHADGTFELVRRRQTLEHMLENERAD